MGWNAVSAIAGTLAAIAVALTVVYLAIQIRKNTLATRSQTHYLLTAALAEAAAILASNEDLARIYRNGISEPDELTEDDFYRFSMYSISQFRRYENLFSSIAPGWSMTNSGRVKARIFYGSFIVRARRRGGRIGDLPTLPASVSTWRIPKSLILCPNRIDSFEYQRA